MIEIVKIKAEKFISPHIHSHSIFNVKPPTKKFPGPHHSDFFQRFNLKSNTTPW